MTMRTVILLSWISIIGSHGLLCAEPPAKPIFAVPVSLDLPVRTHPSPRQVWTPARPRLILFPRFSDLQGTLSVYGKPAAVKAVLELLRKPREEAGAGGELSGLVLYFRQRTEAGGWSEPRLVRKGVQLVLPKDVIALKNGAGFDCRFRLPVELGEDWREGVYEFQAGIWYSWRGRRLSAGDKPQHFEIRKMRPGTGDEIDLLTNAWSRGPRGLRDSLLSRGYGAKEIYTRVLELEEHDAWAKHEYARFAMGQMADPDLAVRLYREIAADYAAGKANRVLGILPPTRCRHVPTKEHVKATIENLLKGAEHVSRQYRAAREEAQRLARNGKTDALLASVTTPKEKSLLYAGRPWLALWSVRLLGKDRTQKARSAFVTELAKLPRLNGLFQRELVNAIAAIDGEKPRLTLDSTSEETSKAIEACLAKTEER